MQKFRKSWKNFCVAVGNGLEGMAKTIIKGGEVAWDWSKKKIKAAIKAVENYIEVVKADAKIRNKIRKNSKHKYWKADIVYLGKYTYVKIASAIKYSEAKSRVKQGKSVFCVNKTDARKLARKYPPVVGPEIGSKDEGQYWHYHVEGRKSKAHIFFAF